MTVIFDMDGTLIDSSHLLSNSINYVRKTLDLEPLEKNYIIEKINNPYKNLAKVFYEREDVTQAMSDAFRDYYSANHQKELIPFDGMQELLKELKNRGFKLGVATNAYKDTTKDTLKYVNLDCYFQSVVTAQDVKNPKPEPDMLFKSMQNLQSKKAIFVGDSQNDKLAAKGANIPFLYVDFINKTKPIKSVKQLKKEIEAIF